MAGATTGHTDTERIEAAVRELLDAIGEDPGRPGLTATPQRVAEAWGEFTAGIGVDPLGVLADTIPAGTSTGELVVIRDIRFRSTCEHHLLPFRGVAHLAYVPGERIVGIGKLQELVEVLASRLQLQEQLGEQLADTVSAALDTRGVLVVLDAVHDCVATRGPRQDGSSVVTVASRGILSDRANRAEAMTMIGAHHGE
ncbi:GTP cyclohydrolase I FolE [soil metagenome]